MRGPYLNVWQALAIFGIVVVSFAALLNYTQDNNEQARNRIERLVYDTCTERKANIMRTNKRNTALADVERDNPFIDDKVRKQRVDIYAVMLEVPDCGSRP